MFRRLIAPMEPAGFVAESWERRALPLPGDPRRFDGLEVDFDRFGVAIGHLPPNSLRANRVESDGTGRYVHVGPEDCRACFDQGMTICVTNLHLAMPRLRELARDTRRALALAGAVSVNAYLSPAGRGFGLHLDPQSVFILQVEGEKHWLYGAEPAAAFPPRGMDAFPDSGREAFRQRHPEIPLAEPGDTVWNRCLLRPGDALYLPPGTWHQGTAGDYSLALTLTCCTLEVSSLLGALLQGGLFTRDSWRRNLPSGLAAGAGLSRERFIADRLDELRQWVAALSPGDVARAWDSTASTETVPLP